MKNLEIHDTHEDRSATCFSPSWPQIQVLTNEEYVHVINNFVCYIQEDPLKKYLLIYKYLMSF